MRRPAAQQMAVAALGHPVRPGQMAFAGAVGVAAQHEPSHLLPVGAVELGVEQAQIGHDVPLVVARQSEPGRGLIGEVHGGLHGHPGNESYGWARNKHPGGRSGSPETATRDARSASPNHRLASDLECRAGKVGNVEGGAVSGHRGLSISVED